MKILKNCYVILLLVFPSLLMAQQIELFQQYNGRYDYLSFGNTLNTEENGGNNGTCTILTESSAEYTLQPGQQIVSALLYWAGSGSGDFDVTFNGNQISSEREFSFIFVNGGVNFEYFAAYADITDILATNGNGNYTLSDLDLLDAIQPYCASNGGNATNFGGWAVTVIYEDNTLPLNQINVFDGLETVSGANPTLTITLDNLDVLDNIGAKIGFLAWEGDVNLAVTETLSVNGNLIGNPPLNPVNNAFNGTNSFTGSDQLYNMDIDFYSIENNISPGDTNAVIQLTSGQDLVMVNNIITVLNTELPDATIDFVNVDGGTECGNRDLEIDYTVFNVNSTASLPAGTPIAFYANTTLIGQAVTTMELPIDGSEDGNITVTVPESIPQDFILRAEVDDDGAGNSTINELNEDNNNVTLDVHLLVFPEIVGLIDQEQCDIVGIETFDLTTSTTQIDPANTISYHISDDDAQNNVNPISDPEAYINVTNPETIYVRVDNGECFAVDSFMIEVIDCPLPDATISIDNDLNACRGRISTIEYTVYNIIGTGILPAETNIAFYIDNSLIAQTQTQFDISIGGSEAGVIDIVLSDDIPDNFVLLAVVDDDGTGTGFIEELDESNNTFDIMVMFVSILPIAPLPDLLECDEGFDMATFDLTVQNELISTNPNDIITFYTTPENANTNTNPISDPEQYQNSIDPQTIYVRLENEICFTTASFLLTTENCVPFIPDGVSPNNDGINDVFEISGLLDIFIDFNLKIYSRQGNLIYEGRNNDGFWDCITNTGLLFTGNPVPTGTYYYVLELNDPEYPKPFLGFVYVNY